MNEKYSESEIKAIVSLLEDPDEEIFDAVSNKLLEMGIAVVPSLEKAWENSLNLTTQTKLENLIHNIQFSNITQEFYEWVLNGGRDLLYGAYIIAKFQYPELKYDTLIQTLNKIKNDAWIELNSSLTALEKVRVLNHIIYDIHHFTGNYNNYYAPKNYYINQVVETKKGNPVSLGIIYITIAQQLDLPVYGVNLPKNFILLYKDLYSNDSQHNALFYINPYNKGAVLGKREIDFFLKQQNLEVNEAYYSACTNIATIERLIRNLINSYESLGQTDKIEGLKKLISIIENE